MLGLAKTKEQQHAASTNCQQPVRGKLHCDRIRQRDQSEIMSGQTAEAWLAPVANS